MIHFLNCEKVKMLILNYRQCVHISERTYPVTLSNEPILQLGSAKALLLGIVTDRQYRTIESGEILSLFLLPSLSLCYKVFVQYLDS